MSTPFTRLSLYLIAIAATCLLRAPAAGQERAEGEKAREGKFAAIVGDWDSIDRHVAIASLFQPEHGVRKRDAVIHFRQEGDRLVGHVVAEDGQKGWKDNRIDFRRVTFADDRLVFEFDIRWNKQNGPLAVEAGRVENKGHVCVEARLKDGKLAGTWKMFLVDGAEVFRGEWEAVRAKKK